MLHKDIYIYTLTTMHMLPLIMQMAMQITEQDIVIVGEILSIKNYLLAAQHYFVFLQTYQLHELGYEVVVLGHKANEVHNSYPIMSTHGNGREFLAKYPQIIKLWKQHFKDHRSDYYLCARVIYKYVRSYIHIK